MENQAASGHRAADGKAITIVVPVFNEESHVAILAEKLAQELGRLSEAWSVLFVDDGSQDGTLARLRELARADSRFGALALSRNFGKEAALAAGLRHASGDAVMVMDADLQHPPEAIPLFVEAWRAGAKVVFGQRQNRVGESAARTVAGFLPPLSAAFRHANSARRDGLRAVRPPGGGRAQCARRTLPFQQGALRLDRLP